MNSSRPFIWIFPALLGLLAGYLVAAGTLDRADPSASRTLGAALYVQTAAEYRACCLQTYNLAAARLAEKLKTKSNGAKPPAVIMDLDETVFDNGGYESYLIRTNQTYSDATWQLWERTCFNEVRLVPGAKEFIESAEKQGVTVVYVSNRFESNRPSTIKAIEYVGLNAKNIEPRLKLFKDGAKTTSKDERRKDVADAYTVLMLFGDNLRDFSDEFKADPVKDVAGRFQAVDASKSRWGDDWIVLPNPIYGEWQRLLGPIPADKLRPTSLGTK
ncbi:MAG: HAD family acid phosphatase [Gemmataceae bacterium]